MAKSKLYIHIGTHRTGSTAIQSTLLQNLLALRKEGIVYFRIPKIVKKLEKIGEKDGKLIRQIRDELNRKIKLEQSKGEFRFVISTEAFCGDSTKGYKNVQAVAESLKEITENYDVTIIAYLRRQDDFLESLYAHEIHAGESCSFDEFIQKFDASSFDWEYLLRCYSDAFGREKIVARKYDKEYLPEKNSLLQDFAKIIDSKVLGRAVRPVNSNSGYSSDAIEIARLTNPHLKDDEKRLLRQIFTQTNPKQLFKKYSFWDRDKREKFISKYSESNAIVSREYFNEPSGELFSFLSIDSDSPAYQGLSTEAVAIVLTKAIVSISQSQLKSKSVLVRAVSIVERKIISIIRKYPRLRSKLKALGTKLELL